MRDRGVNSFEATYQQLAIAWIDEEIQRVAEGMASGAPLLERDTTAIAMGFAQSVHRIRALQDVKLALAEIEQKLMGA